MLQACNIRTWSRNYVFTNNMIMAKLGLLKLLLTYSVILNLLILRDDTKFVATT